MDIILNKTLSEARALIPNEIEVYEYRVWQSNTANKVFVVLNNDNRICMYQENGFDRLMNQIDNLLIGKSISETFTRSIMTSVTVLFAILALVVFGPESTRTLSVTMFLGMFFGTYSSIFIAAPLLVVWNNRQSKK